MTDDFYDLFNRQPPRPEAAALRVVPANGTSSYAAAALRGEAEEVATAPKGARNHTLNKAWFNMGRHVGAGSIDVDSVRLALTDAARTAGLPEQEIETVLRDGATSALNAGAANPRHPTPLPIPTDVREAFTALGMDPDVVGPPLNPIIDWHELFTRDGAGEEWILEPLLPARRMVALYSAPKAGKSLLMLELAVAIARGTDVLGGHLDRPYRVLYIDFENDPEGDILTRLEAMNANPDQLGDLCYLTFPSLAKFDTAQGALDLMRHVEAYGCEVIVIDTVSRAVLGEENENDTWLNFYRHTGLALKRAGVACIRLDHSGKDKEKGMRGGSAKYGDVDAVWRLTAINDTTINLECTDHRMPVPVKSITLFRQDYPLAHLPVGESWQAVADAQVQEVDQLLDRFEVPTTAGERVAGKALREAGHKVNNRALRDAIKLRRMRLDLPVEAPLGRPRISAPGALPAQYGAPELSAPGVPPPLGGTRRSSATAPGAPSQDPPGLESSK